MIADRTLRMEYANEDKKKTQASRDELPKLKSCVLTTTL
jgi:hypothetical protein